MGLLQIVKTGVVQGKVLNKVFEYTKKNNFAIPSVSVINGESVNAVLESAKYSNSAMMIHVSLENAKLFSGKVQKGDASILGLICAANQIHLVTPSYKIPIILTTDYISSKELVLIDELIKLEVEYHKKNGYTLYSLFSIDLSSETLEDSIKIAKKYLKKLSKIGMGLEIKIKMHYSCENELCSLYEELHDISDNFIVSFSFLDEDLQDKKKLFNEIQKKIKSRFKVNSKPLNLSFDGDYCIKKDIREIINTGVVKINLEDEIKNAFCDGINSFKGSNKEKNLLEKNIEPRKWLREIQKAIIKKLNSSIKEYNGKNTL